jgi:hypothetical protein
VTMSHRRREAELARARAVFELVALSYRSEHAVDDPQQHLWY